MKHSVMARCEDCNGSGLYRGMMERDGQAVVCMACAGRGWYRIVWKPFKKRARRRGVTQIRTGSGLILDNPKPTDWMSYAEFERQFPSGRPK